MRNLSQHAQCPNADDDIAICPMLKANFQSIESFATCRFAHYTKANLYWATADLWASYYNQPLVGKDVAQVVAVSILDVSPRGAKWQSNLISIQWYNTRERNWRQWQVIRTTTSDVPWWWWASCRVPTPNRPPYLLKGYQLKKIATY